MAKILMIIAQDNFRDEELAAPKKILENAGHKCIVASIAKSECRGMLGMKIMPDLAVKDAKAEDYAAVVVIGGSGSPELANHKEVTALLKNAAAKGKIMAAICLGPVVLAESGVLNGKKAAVYATKQSLEALKGGNAEYVKEDAVTDGKIITASGPSAAEKFGNKIAELLG